MQKLLRILLIGFTFVALNVGAVGAQTGMTQPPVTDGMPSCAATSPDFVDNGVCDGSAGSAPMSGDTSGTLPTADDSAAPINEGRDMDVGSHRAAPIGDAEESGGPAAQHMNREINDGGFGANSGADAEKARIAAEAQAAEQAAKAEADRILVDQAAQSEINLCLASLKEIDERTFRNCNSAKESVDKNRGGVCVDGLMWHKRYEGGMIDEIRKCGESKALTSQKLECSSAVSDLATAMLVFNGEQRRGDGTFISVRLRRAVQSSSKSYAWFEADVVGSVNGAWSDARDACGF
ncbi:hypothetical protein OAL04_04200 [Nitrospinae bacterium]|nr:hypothetical protein [Nitrospinota bacterium]